ncbi:MAG TPA: hypothetical protein VGG11_17190 [Xanthobacteraceae bacterium]|jgi:hypothetical protein
MSDGYAEDQKDDWASTFEGTAGEGLDARSIHDFIMYMRDEKIHPVLIFGTHGSGKTLMILSLLFYAKQNPHAGISVRLGESVFPPHFPFAKERYSDAQQYYDSLTIQFAQGERPPATQKLVPFFIPIDVEIGGEKFRFALLEGSGEWYEKDEFSYKEFKQEIGAILNTFPEPISVVFVAPTYDERAQQNKALKNFTHECIANCVEQYERRRLARSRDNLLLLVTKWDALHNPSRTDRHFSDASVSDILKEIEPWNFIWTKYLRLNGPKRALMPYSACWINKDGFIIRDARYQSIFDKFNRTLWNWLIGNASEAASQQNPPARMELYSDVKLSKTRDLNLYYKLARTCLWARPDSR